MTDHIVKWLKNYAVNARANGFVVGVSGGIDSAVTSTLCAMTGLKVLCLEMPIHQHLEHVTRAQEHIKQLKSRYGNVTDLRCDLTPVYDGFVKAMPESVASDLVALTLGNTRARLRMTTLYYHGGINGLLVAGTGNKVEDFGVGFYTKYGDGGVDLSPIADLLKSEVYKIGAFVNVPESIMNAAPSDGLYAAEKTDEDQIGASYDELEWAMSYLASAQDLENLSDRQLQVLAIYKDFNTKNQHKMIAIPVCEIPQEMK